MSYTTVKAIESNGKVKDLEEFSNSHGSAPVIWNELAKKYLGLDDYQWIRTPEKIWPLHSRSDIPGHHRALLLMTFDHSLVQKKDFKKAASDIRSFLEDFPAREGYANHWPAIAQIFDSEPECLYIGFNMTSVSDDLFVGEYNEETDKYEDVNLADFWDLYETLERCVK